MSNWVNMNVDVLAHGPEELEQIEIAMSGVNTVGYWTAFEAVKKLPGSDPLERRFRHKFKDTALDVIRTRILEISRNCGAQFLVDYWAYWAPYREKLVIRGGRVMRIACANKGGDGQYEILPDIFAPYRAEYDQDLRAGALWTTWIQNSIEALEKLRDVEELKRANARFGAFE